VSALTALSILVTTPSFAPLSVADSDVPSFDEWRAATSDHDDPPCDDCPRALSRWPRYLYELAAAMPAHVVLIDPHVAHRRDPGAYGRRTEFFTR
jgi:hypothetical protein